MSIETIAGIERSFYEGVQRLDKVSVKDLLISGLYESQNGKVVSKYSHCSPCLPTFRGYDEKKEVQIIVGCMDDIRKDPKTRKGWLEKYIFIPALKTYIIDEHIFLYYTLAEARKLGLVDADGVTLVNFDSHADLFIPKKQPPTKDEDLGRHALYLEQYLEFNNQIVPTYLNGLVEKIIWVAPTPKEMYDPSYYVENLESELKKKFLNDCVVCLLEELPEHLDGFDPRHLAVSIDWDYFEPFGNYLAREEIDQFYEDFQESGLTNFGVMVVATSFSCYSNGKTIPDIKHFLKKLQKIKSI